MHSDLNPKEQEFYERYRAAHEAYQACAWKLERIVVDIKRKKIAGQPPGDLEAARDAANRLLGAELEKIKTLSQEVTQGFGVARAFGKDIVGRDGLMHAIEQGVEREALEEEGMTHPNTLKTALLNIFLKREQEARSSVYKKRFRGGFRETANALIEQERKKNELLREELLAKNAPRLLPQDIDLLRTVFRLRMARHGNEEEALKSA